VAPEPIAIARGVCPAAGSFDGNGHYPAAAHHGTRGPIRNPVSPWSKGRRRIRPRPGMALRLEHTRCGDRGPCWGDLFSRQVRCAGDRARRRRLEFGCRGCSGPRIRTWAGSGDATGISASRTRRSDPIQTLAPFQPFPARPPIDRSLPLRILPTGPRGDLVSIPAALRQRALGRVCRDACGRTRRDCHGRARGGAVAAIDARRLSRRHLRLWRRLPLSRLTGTSRP
jgi:hypothetical protein